MEYKKFRSKCKPIGKMIKYQEAKIEAYQKKIYDLRKRLKFQ